MAESSNTLHESGLSPEALDRHRAIVSVMEELEAVDWYGQRAEVAADPELRAILEHNGDEEREHAAMLIEWLRRNDEGFASHLAEYLSQPGSIVGRESGREEKRALEPTVARGDGSLGIGSLKAR